MEYITHDIDYFISLLQVGLSPLLAIDYGTKKVGLSLTDNRRLIAFAYDILIADGLCWDNAALLDRLLKVIISNKVGGMIIGFPLTLDGDNHILCSVIQKLAEDLFSFLKTEYNLAVPILFVDERFTSVNANRALENNIYEHDYSRKHHFHSRKDQAVAMYKNIKSKKKLSSKLYSRDDDARVAQLMLNGVLDVIASRNGYIGDSTHC